MGFTSRLRAVSAIAVAASLAATGATAASSAASRPAAHHHVASIHPGVPVTLAGVTCEAGFLMHQGKVVYVAFPSSCAGIDTGMVQDGCSEASAPNGMPVTIGGARHRAILVYKSFAAMALHGTVNSHRCYYNDLALARLNHRDWHRASGAVPTHDGPSGVTTKAPAKGTPLTMLLSALKMATAGQSHMGGWEQDVTTSASLTTENVGAPVLDPQHRLLGMVTALPSGVLIKTPAEVYSLHRALRQLHHVRAFRHIKLLRG
ncbi:MAG TPA: hypothetical protein VG708_12505 [Mycobacteriales bacterium]|nr:hypothetical protein [Mycobacteriales bacterium]